MRLYENDGLHPRLTLAKFPYVTLVVKNKMPALVGGFRLAVLLLGIDLFST